MPDIDIAGLCKVYAGNNYAVNDMHVSIEDGEFFTLLGPSGCGKSTTLACIAGLDTPSEGQISIGSKDVFNKNLNVNVPCEERNIGMVFQSYALWPHLTVEENLAVPLKIRKVPKKERMRKIEQAQDIVDLGGLGNRYPHELSGGQQQRVALARALVYSPSVLLLDEPLSNLDARLRDQARVWVKKIQEDLKITAVYVTHDQEEALAMSDRMAVIKDGQIIQCADPTEIYERPANPQVAGFVGKMNFLDGSVSSVGRNTVSITLNDTGEQVVVEKTKNLNNRESVTIAFRPEHVSVKGTEYSQNEPSCNILFGTFISQSYVGSRYEYKIQYGDAVLEGYGTDKSESERCVLNIEPSSIHVF